MKAKCFIFILLVLNIAFTSCKFTPPKITNVRNFQLKERPDNSKAIVLEMQIENDNWVGFKLKNPLATVRLNGQEIGKADAPFNLKVKARSNNYQTIELSSDFDFSNLFMVLLPTLKDGKIRVEVDGSLTVKAPFYKKPMLFKVNEEYSVKDLLKF